MSLGRDKPDSQLVAIQQGDLFLSSERARTQPMTITVERLCNAAHHA